MTWASARQRISPTLAPQENWRCATVISAERVDDLTVLGAGLYASAPVTAGPEGTVGGGRAGGADRGGSARSRSMAVATRGNSVG
jgi:hypothetical protein